jgi:hypothetical protein
MHILVADDQLRSALQAASVWGWGRRAGSLNSQLFERLAEQRKQDATQETEPDRLVRAIERFRPAPIWWLAVKGIARALLRLIMRAWRDASVAP